MPVNKNQKQRIRAAIRDHHLAYKVEVLGEGSVSKRDLRRLKSKGLLKRPSTAAAKAQTAIPAAHMAGTIATSVGDKELKKISPEGFWEYITKAPPKLTKLERSAIRATQDHVGNLITGLGTKVLGVFDATAHAEDQKLRRDYQSIVQEVVATGLAKREGLKVIAASMRKATDDAQRDWERTAYTEINNATEEGKAHSIASRVPKGTDPMVFKRPRPDACRFCVLLYLDGKRPRLFRLSELSANGTNYQRRAGRPTPGGTEWKAVVGSTHPWCFPAGSLVLTAHGERPIEEVREGDSVYTHRGRWQHVTQTMRRHYDDDVVALRQQSGRILRATKEHPFLTSRGWLPAQALDESDNFIEVLGAKVPLPQVDHKPLVFREVVRFLGVLLSLPPLRVPFPTVNLYSDFDVRDSEVDIVDVDGFEWFSRNTVLCELLIEVGFKCREFLSALTRSSREYFLHKGSRFASDCGVRGFHELMSSFLTQTLHPESLLFRGTSHRNIGALQSAGYGASGDIETLRYLQHGETLGIQCDDFFGADIFAEAHRAMTPRYCRDVNVSLSREKFLGDVFNLSVAQDESYVCEGLVVHNCACSLHHMPEGFAFDKTGTMVFVGVAKSLRSEMTVKLAKLVDHLCEAL